MSIYYIAGIVKEDDGSGYSVYFPDVPNVCAGGTTVQEAMEHAAEGLCLALRGLAEDRQEIPEPSGLEAVKEKVKEERAMDNLPYPEDTIYQYIKVPAFDAVPARVNITLPKAMLAQNDAQAELTGMSGSGSLAAAAQAYSA